MGLVTDALFFEILQINDTLMSKIGGRLYNTAIPKPDIEADNEPVPYVVISFNGLTNDETTKDDPYEGATDTVQISIEIAANNREELADLTQSIRDIIHDALLESFEENTIYDYRFTANAVQYDSYKPCYWQLLNYSCSVDNTRSES